MIDYLLEMREEGADDDLVASRRQTCVGLLGEVLGWHAELAAFFWAHVVVDFGLGRIVSGLEEVGKGVGGRN